MDQTGAEVWKKRLQPDGYLGPQSHVEAQVKGLFTPTDANFAYAVLCKGGSARKKQIGGGYESSPIDSDTFTKL